MEIEETHEIEVIEAEVYVVEETAKKIDKVIKVPIKKHQEELPSYAKKDSTETLELPYDITDLNDNVLLLKGVTVEVLGKSENATQQMFMIGHEILTAETWVKIDKVIPPKPKFDEFQLIEFLEIDSMVNPYHIKLIATGLEIRYSNVINRTHKDGWYTAKELIKHIEHEECVSDAHVEIVKKALVGVVDAPLTPTGPGNILEQLAKNNPSLFEEPITAKYEDKSPANESRYLAELRVKYEVKYSMKYKYKYMYKNGKGDI